MPSLREKDKERLARDGLLQGGGKEGEVVAWRGVVVGVGINVNVEANAEAVLVVE